MSPASETHCYDQISIKLQPCCHKCRTVFAEASFSPVEHELCHAKASHAQGLLAGNKGVSVNTLIDVALKFVFSHTSCLCIFIIQRARVLFNNEMKQEMLFYALFTKHFHALYLGSCNSIMPYTAIFTVIDFM